MILYTILFLFFVLIIYILFFRNINEGFDQNDGYSIKINKNDNFDTDYFVLWKNDDIIFKTNGKFTLNEFSLSILDMKNNKTINILRNDNKYTFNNNILTYYHNKIDININNYQDELIFQDNIFLNNSGNIAKFDDNKLYVTNKVYINHLDILFATLVINSNMNKFINYQFK